MKVAIVYNKKSLDEHDVINVFGMVTKEHYSIQTVEQVAKSLEKGGHSVKIIEGGMNFIEDMKDFMPRVVSGDKPGMVFNMAYGIQGQNRYTHVPAMLEMLGIPYTGSGPETHAVVQDKVMTKIVLQKNNLPTPGFWVFTSPNETFDDLIFPVIVKPKMESTSMGMEVVDNWIDLHKAVAKQMDIFSQEILVEQFIPGREFAVGLLGNGNNIEILPIVEMDLKGDPNGIQTITDKLETPVDKICPAPLTEEQTAEIKRISLTAFRKLGLNDFTRVDFRMSDDGHFYVLELNSMASLGKSGSYYAAAKTTGYSYDSLINKMLDVAALRYFGESHISEISPENIETQPLRSVIRSHVRSNSTSNEGLLEQFVNVNSGVTNLEDVNKLGSMLTKRLTPLGFNVKEHHEFDVGNMLYFTNHDSEENDVLLLAHIDTWYTNRDFTPYHKIGNKLYGSGIAECKGGLVTMLAALKSLRFARKLKKIKCGILLVTDDSLGGRFSKQLVYDTAKVSKYIIELKWGLENGGITTSCSGVTRYHIDLTHIRRPDETIKDVVPDMCKKIIAWKKVSDEHNDARITVSEFRARTSFGKSPEHGQLSLESRYITQSQGQRFDSELRRIAKKKDKVKLDIHISKQATRDPMENSDKILKFYELIEKTAKESDIKVNSVHRYATSSLCNVLQDLPMVGGMGPIGSDFRTPNEHIFKDSLIDRSVLLALILNKLSSIGNIKN